MQYCYNICTRLLEFNSRRECHDQTHIHFKRCVGLKPKTYS